MPCCRLLSTTPVAEGGSSCARSITDALPLLLGRPSVVQSLLLQPFFLVSLYLLVWWSSSLSYFLFVVLPQMPV